MVDPSQVVFNQTGHFHDGIAVDAFLKHRTSKFKGGFSLLFFITTLLTKLKAFCPNFSMPFCSNCRAIAISASLCCGTRCISSRTKASESADSPACIKYSYQCCYLLVT